MFYKNKNKQSGFTLVEVIVVIGITGILMALAIPSEISYRHKAELKKSAKELRSLYWEAQSYALAPRNKEAKLYKVAVISQPDGPVPSTTFSEQECRTACEVINEVTLGKNVYIREIKTYGPLDTKSSLVTYFAVGDNKRSGRMSFHDAVGNPEILYDKVEIIFASPLASGLEYKIILDRINNSVNYETN